MLSLLVLKKVLVLVSLLLSLVIDLSSRSIRSEVFYEKAALKIQKSLAEKHMQ